MTPPPKSWIQTHYFTYYCHFHSFLVWSNFISNCIRLSGPLESYYVRFINYYNDQYLCPIQASDGNTSDPLLPPLLVHTRRPLA